MEWLTNPASAGGIAMRADWYIFMGAGTAVGVFVYVCIVWCLIAYRRRDGRGAASFDGNPPLEILYAVVPLLIVVALFVVTYVIEMPIDHVADAASVGGANTSAPNRIQVTAFRWSWRFQYPNGATTYGTPNKPPALYLPVSETSELDLRSDDVTHSFWVPAFLFKRDAIPGMVNVFDITPNRVGSFVGRCAQFCGLDHALMSFVVNVVPTAEYRRMIAARGSAVP